MRKRLRKVDPVASCTSAGSPALDVVAAKVVAPALAGQQDECQPSPVEKEQDALQTAQAAVQREASDGLCVGPVDSHPETEKVPEEEMSIEALLAAEEEKNKALQQAVLQRKLEALREQNQRLEDSLETAPAAQPLMDKAGATAVLGKDSVADVPVAKAQTTTALQPMLPALSPAPPVAKQQVGGPMAPSAWGLDEADDLAEVRQADEHGPRGHTDDPRIDPPIGLQGDIFAEVLWRLEWLLPRMDVRTAAQHAADSRDFDGVDASRNPLPHDSSRLGQAQPQLVPNSAQAAHVFDPPVSGLPDGWTRIYSKSNPGKHYYFNKRTGKTSWEKPLF